jgi:hypothetical protein
MDAKILSRGLVPENPKMAGASEPLHAVNHDIPLTQTTVSVVIYGAVSKVPLATMRFLCG